MNELSVIVLTFNEENNIARAISSIRKISTDIVVVDSGSTDKTAEIARKLGANVVKHNFESFSKQRSFANSLANNKWVLSMDADEEIPSSLGEEIKRSINTNIYSAFFIKRINIIFGKEINHTRFSPDKHVWLYIKDQGSWVGRVHEEWQTKGEVGSLKNAKIHHSHASVFEFLKMINSYSNIEAQILLDKGKRFSFFALAYYSARSFFGRYFYKKGYLDGLYGFVLSVLMAFYRFTTWSKLWEKEKNV